MLLTKTVKIKINNRNIKHYKKVLDNDNIKINDIVTVSIQNVTKGSNVMVKVKCYKCGAIKDMKYKTYNRYDTYYCSKCVKTEKTIKTMNDKYGVDHPLQNKDIKEKFIQTNRETYGVDYPLQNKNVLKKRDETNIKKYGVKHVSLNKVVRQKQILTKIKNIVSKIEHEFISYDFENNKIKLKCNKSHIYEIDAGTIYNRIKYGCEVCTICNPIGHFFSEKEKQLLNFIKENYNDEIIENSRNIISPYEIDIYLPDVNLAFEFDGLYWHSELYKDKNYHKIKSDLCEEKGIQLIHVWEDDWHYKQDIIKSMILNKLGKTPNKIFARNCIIKEITETKLIRDFLDKNHIQGFIGSSVKLGLFYNNELVSLMTFGKKRKIMNSKSKGFEYELLRFCNKKYTNVIGGASRLFNYFIKNYKYTEIITYADRNYSIGKLYEILDFQLIDKTSPNYYYVYDRQRIYRFNFRKDVLIKEGYNSSKSEHEIMLERKIYRIYNAGNLKYQLKFKH